MGLKLVNFESTDGLVKLEVTVDENNSIWLTQLQMAELFDATKQNISLHIGNLSLNDSFHKNNVKKFRKLSADGKRYVTNHYSFEVISNIAFRTGILDRYEEFYNWCKKFGRVPTQI